jgi:ADP-ribose pyrophosphatase YjhB (NUDIX family)
MRNSSSWPKPGVSKKYWLPKAEWDKTLHLMSIPCVDLILERSDKSILYGWRMISPYRRVWALVGGRILRGEDLLRSSFRVAKEYGLHFNQLYLNGVFPINFRRRSDIAISLAARNIEGVARVDEVEFSKFSWSVAPPRNLGANYRTMVNHWKLASRSMDFLRLSRLL